MQYRYKRRFAAANGSHGRGKQQAGKSGKDLVLEVPVGTIIYNDNTGEIIADCLYPEKPVLVARGGRGGRGNMHFTSSTNRAPRFAQPGEPGESVSLRLELKLLADVGIIGFPNAGKSLLLSKVSAARPKVADYPFTTLAPVLGVVKLPDREPFVIADIPGLIEGAHQGAGLGTRFLKHIERTRVLLHVIDSASIDINDPLSRYKAIISELAGFDPGLAEKKQIIALNKIDLPGASSGAEAFIEAYTKKYKDSGGEKRIFTISALTGEGVSALMEAVHAEL